jgi:putative transposase
MRAYNRLRVRLKRGHRAKLSEILSGGVHRVRTVVRALTLSQLHKGGTASQVAAHVGMTAKGVREIGRRYEKNGLEAALYDKPRPGQEPLLNEAERQRIIAMVCSDPPEGRARWTVRLTAEEAVKRKLVPRVGRETIRILMLHHDLKPWREKNVVYSGGRR